MGENLPDTNVGNIEYISKQDAVDMCRNYPHLAYLMSIVVHADVVPVVHARWENYSPITIKCSRCGHVIHDWRYSECKFCPNCGAKMDGGDEHG